MHAHQRVLHIISLVTISAYTFGVKKGLHRGAVASMSRQLLLCRIRGRISQRPNRGAVRRLRGSLGRRDRLLHPGKGLGLRRLGSVRGTPRPSRRRSAGRRRSASGAATNESGSGRLRNRRRSRSSGAPSTAPGGFGAARTWTCSSKRCFTRYRSPEWTMSASARTGTAVVASPASTTSRTAGGHGTPEGGRPVRRRHRKGLERQRAPHTRRGRAGKTGRWPGPLIRLRHLPAPA